MKYYFNVGELVNFSHELDKTFQGVIASISIENNHATYKILRLDTEEFYTAQGHELTRIFR